MRPERNLGEELSAALEAGPSRTTLAVQRGQVLAALAKPEPLTARYALLAGGAALALAAVVLAPRWLTRPSAAELRGAWQGKSLPESSRVVAPPERGETLSFSDGSQLALGARAEIALSKLAPEQAHLELARGHVDATIRKGTGRTWTLAAGPYSVRVVGTEFTVDWDASSRFFAVNVREGKVLVSGGELRSGGILLGAGERIERQAPPVSGSDAPAHASDLKPLDAPPPVTEPSAPRGAASTLPSNDDFRPQAAHGNYSAAMAAARRAGFEHLLRELPAKDLLLLANTARYAGSSPEARGALQKLRERFPGSPSAAHAALLLASQAEDRDKDSAEAERWLRIFLTESPQGELAAGARARLLAMLLKRGAQAEAEQVARDYLRLHPNGQHVARARAVLQLSP
jgi:hypothetical protein